MGAFLRNNWFKVGILLFLFCITGVTSAFLISRNKPTTPVEDVKTSEVVQEKPENSVPEEKIENPQPEVSKTVEQPNNTTEVTSEIVLDSHKEECIDFINELKEDILLLNKKYLEDYKKIDQGGGTLDGANMKKARLREHYDLDSAELINEIQTKEFECNL